MEAQAQIPDPSVSPAPSRPVQFRTTRRRLWADRAATWTVTGGGLAIIASILGILFFIVIEIYPMLRGAKIAPGAEIDLGTMEVGAVIADEHRSHAAVLTRDGHVRVVDLESGRLVRERRIVPGEEGGGGVVEARPVPGQQLLTAATGDGRVVAIPFAWEVSFDEDRRVVDATIGEAAVFEMDLEGRPVREFAARIDREGAGLAAAQLADGSLVLVEREVTVNLFTEEVTENWSRTEAAAPETISVMVLDAERRNLYAGAASGKLYWWSLAGATPGPPQILDAGGSGVTALSLLIGDRSLVVGLEDGSIAIWFAVRQADESFRLTRIRDFPPHPGPVRLLAPSLRDKGFLAQDDTGRLGLYYSTSRRVLWTGPSPIEEATAMFYTPKADGAIVGGAGRLASLDIRNRHPEISFGALFGKVWYEGYEKPEYVWQSTGGTDDFEPKLSLTPLLIGTLKGTIYSLILAVPLGVLGAMYTSQFLHPSLKRYIKPAVEIMAALPSVVLGFLAGLWLAPRVEKVLPAIFLVLLIGPIAVVLTGYAWRSLPLSFRQRFAASWETLLHMVVLSITVALCIWASPRFEAAVFGGDVQAWLLDATGLAYDQRNAVVVGLAMGFAVIPIIFSIAEDAFSNVPRNLTSGSLALGANRWQTVTRVVLPTASPGIFSAIMIGFGRAIGETMIVLMATGNTPITDWNPFNGFRTLSANIAVEIPEAPHGATLYRTLFLAALLLFAFTFAINTVGDLVRQRLRKRYAEL
jgi:phosphate transport system permease protein